MRIELPSRQVNIRLVKINRKLVECDNDSDFYEGFGLIIVVLIAFL